MQTICEDRVVIVTGAARGIGRAHALMFAEHGAKVIVNDLGSGPDGQGASSSPAQDVVDDIRANGGEAAVSTHDVSHWAGAKALIGHAIDTYGRLDVLVNNAGILRDRMIVNMSEDEWDAVTRVHLRGTFAPLHWAAVHWRSEVKAGRQNDARVINTVSASGIYGNVGQANYGAAKAGIAALTVIAAMELGAYGVTCNAVGPRARTRLTEGLLASPNATAVDAGDVLDPSHISPLVTWLGSTHSASVTGRVFDVSGERIAVAEGWSSGPGVDADGGWTLEVLDEQVPALVAQAQPNANMHGVREHR